MRKEITAATQHKDTLIGMILRPKDLRTAREQGWYRIPVKSAPEVVTSGALNTLALYQTKAFDEEKYSVRWWGDVIDIDKKKRIALLPEEPADRNAQEWYYGESSSIQAACSANYQPDTAPQYVYHDNSR